MTNSSGIQFAHILYMWPLDRIKGYKDSCKQNSFDELADLALTFSENKTQWALVSPFLSPVSPGDLFLLRTNFKICILLICLVYPQHIALMIKCSVLYFILDKKNTWSGIICTANNHCGLTHNCSYLIMLSTCTASDSFLNSAFTTWPL